MKLLASVLTVSLVLSFAGANAQNVGKAADKQKQENLEKNKRRQAELKKKYDAMTPEQKAEAKAKADAYKSGKLGKGTVTAKTKESGVTSKTTEQKTQGTVKATNKKSPVWMDEKGKPKAEKVTTKVGQVEKKPVTPAPIKSGYNKNKTVNTNAASKAVKPVESKTADQKKK